MTLEQIYSRVAIDFASPVLQTDGPADERRQRPCHLHIFGLTLEQVYSRVAIDLLLPFSKAMGPQIKGASGRVIFIGLV